MSRVQGSGLQGRIDLNADVGEGFADDAELLQVVSSANVACGFHAGDAETMRWTCGLAAERGVAIGAQVSYRDREGFGRRDVEIARGDLVADLTEQVEALQVAAATARAAVRYVKPHGALYNRCVDDSGHAAAVVDVAEAFELPILGLPGSELLEQAGARGVVGRREFFADRAYDARGRLVARAVQGSVISDPDLVVERVRRLFGSGTVLTVDGGEREVVADSICVHGDSPGAAALARAVSEALRAAGVTVSAIW